MPYYCGIDLGTTNSTISIIQVERRRDNPIESLTTIPIYQFNESFNEIDKGKTLLPSFLYFVPEKKVVYTGYYAKSVYTKGNRPMQTATAVKTRIGSESILEIPAYNKPSFQPVQFDMTQCSAFLLKTIRQSFEEQYHEKIENVVITVPAAFNTDEREATLTAAKMAGFDDPIILDEPTATLLDFINEKGDVSSSDNLFESEESKNILVYDLGGGTLDVCIANLSENEDGDTDLKILARSPREDLGGNDFDQLLAAYFLYDWEKARASIESRPIDEQNTIISRLVAQAENYKIMMNEKIIDRLDGPERLLERVKAEVVFEVISGMKVDMSLNKETLENVFASITMPGGRLVRPIEHCMQEAGLQPKDIYTIVLTGGMTKYYAVRQAIEQYFGADIPPIVEVDAQNSVSRGAAIHCYNEYREQGFKRLTRIKLSDRMADDVFIRVNGKFEKLIPRETTEGSGIVDYIVPQDRMIKIPIFLYHGLDENPAAFSPISGKYLYPDENTELHEGDIIKLRWSIDKNKIITITLAELNKSIKIESGAGNNYSSESLDDYIVNPSDRVVG